MPEKKLKGIMAEILNTISSKLQVAGIVELCIDAK